MNKTFKVAQVRDLLNQVNNKQITFSLFVEILNEAQKESYNQAIEDAAEKAEVAEIEIIPPKPYDQRPYKKYIVNRDSILKLKK